MQDATYQHRTAVPDRCSATIASDTSNMLSRDVDIKGKAARDWSDRASDSITIRTLQRGGNYSLEAIIMYYLLPTIGYCHLLPIYKIEQLGCIMNKENYGYI